MKKVLASVLALTMTAVMFTSCGDSDSSSKSESKAASSSKAAETTTTTTTAETTTTAAESEAPSESEADTSEAEGPAEFDITKVNGYDENATETVLEFTDQVSDAWVNGLGSYVMDDVSGDDFIDGRTFDRDKDVHMVVEFAYTESFENMIKDGVTDQHMTQIVIGPAHANGWNKFGETYEGLISDYPSLNDPNLTEYVKANGEDMATPETKDVKPKTDQVWPDVFIKEDGFIKIGNHDVTSIEFTIPAAEINKLIDNAEVIPEDEEHWGDGVLFQIGGNMYITKITIDQGNVFLRSQIAESGM